jgi:hypothetical protein
MSKTKQVVINKCHGGFGLSAAGMMRYAEIKGIKLWVENSNTIPTYWTVPPEERQVESDTKDWNTWTINQRTAWDDRYKQEYLYSRDFDREDPTLIQVVNELGKTASGSCADLVIVEIPADVNYEIKEYDGMEHIAEVHRTW